MKRLGSMLSKLIAVVLVATSMQAQAATQKPDREFNHMSTGFPLNGVHASTPCESCHIGGVFIGTPKVCDGCHAVGQRVVATPKSTNHIVTDAPCDTCHFNTSTFFGARFNHGTAKPGECGNCHNGRIMPGKPSGHPVTIYACDNCHRSTSWLPASWNHRDTVSDCSTCHKAGGPGRNYGIGHLPMSMPPATFSGNCKACHSNYYTFLSAYYNHSNAGAACQNCHGSGGATVAGPVATYTGVRAAGTAGVQSVHAAIGAAPFAAATCQSCHNNYATFIGARYNHAGVGTSCGTCHASPASTYAGYLQLMSTAAGNIHPAATTVGIISGSAGCDACHSMSNFSVWSGSYNHADAAYTAKMAVNSCAGCHDGSAPPIKAIPVNHTNAFNAGLVATPSGPNSCNACHTTSSTWVQMNHNALTAGGVPCKNCHDSGLNPGLYFANMSKKSNGHKGYNQATQDCISCHAKQFNRWNHP